MPNEAEDKDNDKEPDEESVKKKSAFTKKLIRIFTVIAYIAGVSGGGFLMSLYYLIFWDPQITAFRPPGYLKSPGNEPLQGQNPPNHLRPKRSTDHDHYDDEEITSDLKLLINMIRDNINNDHSDVNDYQSTVNKNINENNSLKRKKTERTQHGVTNEISPLVDTGGGYNPPPQPSPNEIPSYKFENILEEEELKRTNEIPEEKENNFIPIGKSEEVGEIIFSGPSINKIRKRNQINHLESENPHRTTKHSTMQNQHSRREYDAQTPLE